MQFRHGKADDLRKTKLDIECRRVCDVNTYYILIRFYMLIYFSFFNFEQTLCLYPICHALAKKCNILEYL